ncbi:SEC14-like protein 2 [Argiope bruennichi]|uniref:SEC14-like protein 2 n=1 Tax=Argiope bruennichi TaxID=94029 RepID=UPI0024954AFC|nr:SEC14-like protein 2 [Argiope bruennichi]
MTQEDIIADEQRNMDELRRRLKPKMSEEMYADDDMFIRFLRARGYNLDAAEEMLTKHLQWRKYSNVGNILKEYEAPEVLEKYLSLNFMGYDKDGYPTSYCAFGNIDVKGLAKCIKKSEITKYMMHHLEKNSRRLHTQSEKLGKKIDKWNYVINFENFSLASATDKKAIDVLITLVKMYDANYPERLKTGYLINASFYFTIIWSVIKPFLSAETNRKIKIFGKEGWQEELKRDIGVDHLPKFLGGNASDTHIKHGGTIPPKYYVHRDRKSFSKLPGVKRLVVNRRSKENIKLEVQQPGLNIEWDFDVKNRDIGFSLIYEDPEKKPEDGEEIVPKQRVDTIIQSESGLVKCEKPGTYILQFDNSFSWMHNKIIYYYASVVNPNDVINEEED